jgi:nicotinamidase-related amidase
MFPLDPNSTALVVVDMQNDFVRAGAPIEVPTARGTVQTQKRLLRWFRDNGRLVVFTKSVAGPQTPLIGLWHPECLPPVRACWPGVWRSFDDVEGQLEGTEIIDDLRPEPTEPVVEKYGYNAFHRTQLTDILRGHGVDTVVVTGTVTQLCIEDTVRGAYHEGFKAVVIADAVSSNDDAQQRATLAKLGANFAWVMSSGDALTELGAVLG